ncbi:MAG TPA: translation factor GTPase family protein [Pilimelia sp.]|nr:translation factor GTPase family protein [Pilimelia sp.]
MRAHNLGILAHVDAGKTSLTERLLYAAGVIDEIGSVDHGNTQTDSLALERQRGITIKSAVVSFVIDGVTVNLIDTPGHPDFIAEVERVLSVLDGAVLVVSAVEGVQAQTRVLMRTLQRLRIPTLLFVNKLDRRGARYDGVLREIAAKLTPAVVPMGSAAGLGTRGCAFTPYGPGDAGFVARLRETLAEHDDALLAAYVRDETALSYGALERELADQTARALVHPVYFGSAISGAGVGALAAGVTRWLPAAAADVDAPASGAVFKVDRGPAGEKVAYVRMFAGTVRTRDRLRFAGDREGKVTAIAVFDDGAAVGRDAVGAGRIGKLWGLDDIRVGDTVGVPHGARPGRHQFAPPTLETVVLPRRPADRGALHVALSQLAEQDPLINLRQDDERQEISVSLYGEVQKEVIEATLAADFGLGVTFRETTTICIERPTGVGAAAEFIGVPPNPFRATVGLRVEPAPVGAGVDFRLAVELGAMPLGYFTAVEETVRETLRQGLSGWQVTDCVVTMTHAAYKPPPSTAGDFRHLTPLVLMSALAAAGTAVSEPMHRFRLELPADLPGAVLPVLTRLRAVALAPVPGGASCVLTGEIPAARVHELQQRLPGLTRGEGVLESAFARYRPVRGTVPHRPRWDHNPLNRKEYLLRVVRRTSGRRDDG